MARRETFERVTGSWRSGWAGTRRGGVVVAVVVLVGLGGCGPAQTAPRALRPAPEPAASVPQPGDCWNEPDYTDASSWSWWPGSPPVDCTAEHNSITLAVAQLDEDFTYARDGEGTGLSDEQFGTIRAACEPPGWEGLSPEEGSRVTWFWYLPTPREWATGARWVRCDVALIALGPLSPKTLEPLPPTADELLPGISGEYRLCLDTPHPANVYGPWYDPEGSVAVPCDGQAQWEFGLRVDLPDGPFPGEEAAKNAALQPCQDLVNSRVPDRWGASLAYPNEQTWAQGSRSARCWLR